MKKLLCAFVAGLAAMNASAQVEKGSWLLSATTNFGYVSYTPTSGGSNLSIFNLGLKSGYFVGQNFSLGVNLDYVSSSGSSSSSTYTTVGVFLRGYANNVFFGAGYNSTSATGSTTNYGSIPFEVGYAAFITRNISFEPALTYTIATDSDQGGLPGYAGIPFSAKSAFGVRFGFSLYLGRPAVAE